MHALVVSVLVAPLTSPRRGWGSAGLAFQWCERKTYIEAAMNVILFTSAVCIDVHRATTTTTTVGTAIIRLKVNRINQVANNRHNNIHPNTHIRILLLCRARAHTISARDMVSECKTNNTTGTKAGDERINLTEQLSSTSRRRAKTARNETYNQNHKTNINTKTGEKNVLRADWEQRSVCAAEVNHIQFDCFTVLYSWGLK